jgi:hypothetical protein
LRDEHTVTNKIPFLIITFVKNNDHFNIYTMKTKKYFFLMLFVLIGLTTVAQTTDIPTLEAADNIWRTQEMKDGKLFINHTAIAGNPYLNKDFQDGRPISKYNLTFSVIPLRYNIYTDNIEYKSPDNKIFALKDQDKLKAYKIGDATFIYSPYYKSKDTLSSGYFQVLVTGKATGLVKYTVYLLEAQPERPYLPAKPERFSQVTKSFYIKMADGVVAPASKEKEILRLFPKYDSQLR